MYWSENEFFTHFVILQIILRFVLVNLNVIQLNAAPAKTCIFFLFSATCTDNKLNFVIQIHNSREEFKKQI